MSEKVKLRSFLLAISYLVINNFSTILHKLLIWFKQQFNVPKYLSYNNTGPRKATNSKNIDY